MYYTYLLLTEKGSFYCGYTDNIEKRFQKHLSGKGAKYTRANKPVKIAYSKEFEQMYLGKFHKQKSKGKE